MMWIFVFVLSFNLSRKLGQVQFFSANRIFYHHAWVRTDAGRILRAYAWAGRTLWQQGAMTPAEVELDVHCFDYGEPDAASGFVFSDLISCERRSRSAARRQMEPRSSPLLTSASSLTNWPGRRAHRARINFQGSRRRAYLCFLRKTARQRAAGCDRT